MYEEYKIEIKFTPNEKEIEDIFSWTSSDRGEIWDCYKKTGLVIAKINDKVIGYIAYKIEILAIYISLAETKDLYKKQGVAKLLISNLIEEFSKLGYIAVYLFCSPIESQYIWNKLGFSYYPENALKHNSRLYMNKIFGSVCKINLKKDISFNDNFIEIWDCENPQKGKEPKWIVNFN